MSDVHQGRDELVAILAPSLGEARALELVQGAITALGITKTVFSRDEAVAILRELSEKTGHVGSVARFALAKYDLEEVSGIIPRPRSSTSMRATKDGVIRRADLTELLAPTLGQAKSEQVVLEALREEKLLLEELTLSQGLMILEKLALAPGIVGVAARFAKAHLLMRTKT